MIIFSIQILREQRSALVLPRDGGRGESVPVAGQDLDLEERVTAASCEITVVKSSLDSRQLLTR
jgi:hypothetical protein